MSQEKVVVLPEDYVQTVEYKNGKPVSKGRIRVNPGTEVIVSHEEGGSQIATGRAGTKHSDRWFKL